MKKLPRPKFNIGDTVIMMPDEWHFNPACKAASVGIIESIIFHMEGPGKCHCLGEAYINYSVSGFSLNPSEENIELWDIDKDTISQEEKESDAPK